MIKKKTFKDNQEYFNFYEKMRDKIEITFFKILKHSIKIEYKVSE